MCTDGDAENAAVLGEFGLLYVRDECVDALVVKAHAVDDGLGFWQAKQAWFWVAQLWPRCDGADFDEAETEAGEHVDVFTVFIQPCGQTDAIWKSQSHALMGLSGL